MGGLQRYSHRAPRTEMPRPEPDVYLRKRAPGAERCSPKESANTHIQEVDWSTAFTTPSAMTPAKPAFVVDAEVGLGFHAYTRDRETIGRPLLSMKLRGHLLSRARCSIRRVKKVLPHWHPG